MDDHSNEQREHVRVTATKASEARPAEISPLIGLLRCLHCRSALAILDLRRGRDPELGPDGTLGCTGCDSTYPISGGTVRMVQGSGAGGSAGTSPLDDQRVKQKTAESFGYEWKHFGRLRAEWRRNFLDYLRPHRPEWFQGRLVLDVGTGSGRHAHQAAALGAQVAAVDLGPAVDAARRNLPLEVLTVQADAEDLPFEPGTFDLVMSIGVLHHLPNPERAFQGIVPMARPEGYVHIYVYWVPPNRAHQRILAGVTAARRVTVRLPHRLLHMLCYPLAAGLFITVVLPYRTLRRRPRSRNLAAKLPLKTYADYPFAVCVNDQFDRFSAPIERRYRAEEVDAWLANAGLEHRRVLANHGWLGSGRRAKAP